MNDNQIEQLKSVMDWNDVCWMTKDNVVRLITGIGPARLLEGEDPEPSDVAYFDNGEYVALWNCEPTEFVIVTMVFEVD